MWGLDAVGYNFFTIIKTQDYRTTRTKNILKVVIRGGSRGGRTRRAPPLKLEKIWFFGVKSWFFTRNTPQIFAPPSAIGKNMIFWRKIVIFHTKYPQNFSASLRSAQFFLSAPPPPNLKSWNRPWLYPLGQSLAYRMSKSIPTDLLPRITGDWLI
jgi:hypothetical protein